jgi:peptide-methionine (S)-S-oxide reductase
VPAGRVFDFSLQREVNREFGGGKMTQQHQVAVFGGGCFWCTEAVFDELRGVSSVIPGYAGGNVDNPSYEQVCSGLTGHAEVIRIDYDPALITYMDLLTVFFATHDPTTLNRQGNDVGTQYRSVIFYGDEQQKREAESFIKELNESKSFTKPIVTTMEPLGMFYPAEDYHHDYYARNRYQPYCQVTIPPKLEKLRKRFAELLKSRAAGGELTAPK